MNQIKQCFLALLLITSTLCAKADCLWIIGDATPYGWDTDNATALLSAADSHVFSGTIYLKAGQDFKFMTKPDWGNLEYGAAPGASLVNGEIALAKGTDDSGYAKLQVADNGNYLITVSTDDMTAKIVKSEYQDSEITICSLFLVGSATPNGWDVMNGTPLYQNAEKPYLFKAENLSLDAGSFKIAIALKGACSWNPAYWYFRDASADDKIAKDQDGDIQWNIDEKDAYTVAVNVIDNSISITKTHTTSITSAVSDTNGTPEYYTLTGLRVDKPEAGVYICKNGKSTKKIIIK
ncbi:MAG: SusF/SusE family outer membrane protein [Muribaculaceae bacterium]|nr:SusF/SusE family outer membrane protein [Muribaculaceae bacterium]